MALGNVMSFGGTLCKWDLLSHQFCRLICSVTVPDFSAKKNSLIHFFFNEERSSREIGGCTLAEVGGEGHGGKALPPLLFVGALGQTVCACPQLRQGKQHSSKWLLLETFLCRSWFTEKTILSRGIRVLVPHQTLIFSLLPLPPVIVFPLCTDSKLELGVRGTN